MNAFYVVVDTIKERLRNNPNCNTVLFGRTEDKDLYKKNIYPIAHINPVAAPMNSNQVHFFAFEIACLDIRDISKKPATDKFDGNDDLQDNLNITYSILSDLVSYLKTIVNEEIELNEVSSAEPLLFTDHNILDGWVITVTLKIPKRRASSGGNDTEC
jgi:hypothetical protein